VGLEAKESGPFLRCEGCGVSTHTHHPRAPARKRISPLVPDGSPPLHGHAAMTGRGREGALRQLGWYRAILRPDIRGAFILPEKNHFKEAIKH